MSTIAETAQQHLGGRLLQSEHAPAPSASQCDQHSMCDQCGIGVIMSWHVKPMPTVESVTSLQHMFYSKPLLIIITIKFLKAKSEIKNHFNSTRATLQNLSTADLRGSIP